MSATDASPSSAYPPSIQAGIPRLGRLPRGWSRARLGDLLSPVNRPVEIIDDDIYQLVTAKRSRGGIVARERLLGRDIKVKDQYQVRAGDFILSNRQISHGGVGIVPPELDGAIVSGEYTVLEPCGPIDLAYLGALSHSIYFQQICFHSSIGVHVEKLVFKLDDWFAWKINLPPLDEQRRIANALAVWDRAIEIAEALVAAKRRQASRLARNIAKEPNAQNWAITSLGEVARLRGGTAFPEIEQGGTVGDYPFIKVSDFDGARNSRAINSAANWVTEEQARRLGATLHPAGAVVFAKVGAALKLNRRRILTRPTIIDNNIMSAEASSAVLPEFLYFWLTTIDLGRWAQDGGVPSVNQAILNSLPLNLPPLDEQRRIADALAALGGVIEAAEALVAALRMQKRGLVQKLLTGDWRLSSDASEQAA